MALATIETVTTELFECPDCAFRFDSVHVTQATGKHDCPVCELDRVTAERDQHNVDSRDSFAKQLRYREERDAAIAERDWYKAASQKAHWDQRANELAADVVALEKERDAALAQVARLREELMGCLITGKDGLLHHHDCMGQHDYPCKAWCAETRAALAATEKREQQLAEARKLTDQDMRQRYAAEQKAARRADILHEWGGETPLPHSMMASEEAEPKKGLIELGWFDPLERKP